MKRTFNKLDKMQIFIARVAWLLVILEFAYVNLTEVAFILMFISLLVNEVRDFKKAVISKIVVIQLTEQISWRALFNFCSTIGPYYWITFFYEMYPNDTFVTER